MSVSPLDRVRILLPSVVLVDSGAGTSKYLCRAATYATPNGDSMAFSLSLRDDHANYAAALANLTSAYNTVLTDGTASQLLAAGIVQTYPWVRSGFVSYPNPNTSYF